MIFLMIGVVTGVFLVQEQQYFRLSASTNYAPKDVRVTNITEDSFSVSFYTDKPALTSLRWGDTEPTNLSSPADKRLSNLHYFTIDGLLSDTSYQFKIISGGDEYDNNGVAWKVQTASTIEGLSNKTFVSGNVTTDDGQPASKAIVYIHIGGASSISTQASEEGTYLVSLSGLRTQIMDKYASIDESDTINIFVQGGPLGVATARTNKDNINPVPLLVLGSSYNFSDSEAIISGGLPSAEINLPEDNIESRFELSDTPLRTRRN